MMPKLYKAAEVCDMTQVPAYVLRSWEKEFPGIGVQRSQDSARLYRQTDVDQVLRIKQLVFAEGLTLAGARRRLEESEPHDSVSEAEVAEVIEALGDNARVRLITVREGLQSILQLLSGPPGSNGHSADVSHTNRSGVETRSGSTSRRGAGARASSAGRSATDRSTGGESKARRSVGADLQVRPPSKRSAPKVRSIATRTKASSPPKPQARTKAGTKSKTTAKRKRANA